MTNSSPEPSDRPNVFLSLWRFARQPSTLIVGGITLVGIGTIGYFGVRYFVYERLTPLLETQLSQLLKRPVKIGQVEDFSFTHIRVGSSSIPKTANDPDTVSLKAIEVGFNPFPLLVGRPLPLEVKLIDPDLYLEQDKTGKWIALELETGKPQPESPIKLDVSFQIESANISVKPYAISRPVTLQVDGKGRFTDDRDQPLQYDFDGAILNSKVRVQGETHLKTGKSQTQLVINQLALGELSSLIPHSPLKVKQGQANANLAINIPSFENIEGTRGTGQLQITEVSGKIQPLQYPIQLNTELALQGEKLVVEKAIASVGSLKTNITGDIDWKTGYNLQVALNSIDLHQLLKLLSVQSPLPITGEAKANFSVTGKIDQPLLKGNIINTKTIRLDKLPFKLIKTDFQTNLNTLTLDNIQVQPLAGGKITANGNIQLKILQSLQKQQAIDGTKMPIAFTAKADLPTQAMLVPYARFSSPVRIGNLNADVKVGGSLGLPKVLLNWQIPPSSPAETIGISGRGTGRFGESRFTLTDTVIKTNGGQLKVNADGDLKTQQLKAKVTANAFLLTPFLPIICDNVPNLCPYLRQLEPIELQTANIQLKGRLDKFSLETLDGLANLGIQTKQGTILVNSQVSRGNLQADTFAEGLPVNSILPDLPARVQLVRSRFKVAGFLPPLFKNDRESLKTWRGEGDFRLSVDNKPLNVIARIDRGQIQGNVHASGIHLNPFVPDLTLPVSLGTTRMDFAGELQPLLQGSLTGLKTWRGNGDIVLFVNDRPLQTTATLDRGILSGVVQTEGFSLASFLPQTPLPLRLGQTRLNFSSPIDALLAGKTPDIGTLSATGNLAIFLAGNPLNANIRLNNGIFNTTATVNGWNLQRLLPKLPVPVRILRGNGVIQGNAKTIFNSFRQNKPDLGSITATLNSTLALANGTVQASARLAGQTWQGNVIASDLDTTFLVGRLTQQKPLELPNLNANASLAGNIADLSQGTTSIEIKNLVARSGQNSLETRGTLLLTNLIRQPDIATLTLNLQGKSDLGRFPLASLVSRLPIDARLLPSQVKLTGIGEFKGNITGKNLITAFNQPGSLRIDGNVTLANLSFNDRSWEPRLAGRLRGGTGQTIDLDLGGRQDRIALSLDPCHRSKCLAPYLPLAFNLQQVYGSQTPLIVNGKRQGDRLVASIEQFPLEWLKIAPITAYSLPGFLGGNINANFDLDLFTLNGRGQLRVDRPSLGKLTGETITADLIYEEGVARLRNASLQAGRSRYDLEGLFNVKTGEIQANFKIGQGYIQDLLLAARVSDVESLLRFFSPPDYAKASEIHPTPVGDPNAPLSQQVNLLAKIHDTIRELANQRDYVGIPTELDVSGRYQANIALEGTIANPKLAVQFQGKHWEWRPQQPTVDIVDHLGLITTATQLIPIDEITLNATLDRHSLAIQPIRLVSRSNKVILAGNFSLEKLDATFDVQNLSLDLLRNFVPLPVDVSGSLKTEGRLTGTIFNPRLQGNFAFIDGAINAQSLEQSIAGQFTYTNSRFDIRTTASESIQLYASIPYPPLPGNDRLRIQGRLGTEAITLIEAITQNAIDWVGGDGEIALDATGRLDTSQGLTIKDFVANGVITLKDAAIRSSAFPQVLTVNGRIGFTPERLTVESLEGSFANRQISVAGILPFFEPIAHNPNPLTVNIEQGEVTLENLYRGSIDGQATITGTIQKPVIGGEVRLSQGQVFIPHPIKTADEVDRVAKQWIQPIASVKNHDFAPLLQNFKVVLEGLSIEQEPLYQFAFSGALNLSGPLDQPQKLRPEGLITLDRGRISYLDTRFLLNRRNRNTIVFDPNRGLLNPNIDIQMRTILTEVPQSRNFETARPSHDFPSNEVPDNSLNRVQRVDVTLAIAGELNQLLPNFAGDMNDVCMIRPDGLPFPEDSGYSTEKLDRLFTCIRTVALARGQDQQLLHSSMIKLTSSPPRSEGEIIRLLGDQLFALFNGFQGLNTEQLVQFGVVQLAIPLVAQSIVDDVESTIGNSVGATDFNILPNLETVYRVDKQAFVRFSYDYNFNQFTIRYETQF